ncbi:hypothetical protein [Brevundimonas sp.]|uniref:hypothetical protein n=1 Tax=Brevundimonas sp. TaxID=1871086 RepID=UPI0028971AA0|nr:hypothetical protein [Brevundimonas sp.]
MGSILLGLLFNPGALIAYAGLALVAVGIYFALGPARLLKIATDIRTWFALALILAVLAFAHSEKRADALEAQIAVAAAQGKADRDAGAVTETRRQQQEGRRQQTQRIDDAIQAAPPGEAQDAALDAIAAERPDYHGLQDEEGPARADPGATADGMRRQPDGVVVL